MSAGDLTYRHLGRTVKVITPEGDCTGVLTEVSHRAQMVSDGTIRDPDRTVMGRCHVHVTLQYWGPRQLHPTTPVDVLP